MSLSGFGLCSLLALVFGFVQPVCAQPVVLSSLTLSQSATGFVWDATRSRFFASSGTNVLMINPETAQIEDTIPLGSSYGGQIAVSGDGQYLYVSPQSNIVTHQHLGVINRYLIQSHSLDLQIPLGQFTDTFGFVNYIGAQAIAVLPGHPSSIVVATTHNTVIVFDAAVPRSVQSPLSVNSLYARPSDGAVFGVGDGVAATGNDPLMFGFSVTSAGIAVARSVPLPPGWDSGVTWNGSLATNRSSIFDLNAWATVGSVPQPVTTSGQSGACPLTIDASGTSVLGFQYTFMNPGSTATLTRYSVATFQPIASAAVTGLPTNFSSLAGLCSLSSVTTWGKDGVLINPYDSSAAYQIYFLHSSVLSPLSPVFLPAPTLDSSGVIHLALSTNAVVYDSGRGVLWASIPGNAAAAGNSVVSIDPGTGNVLSTIYAGSEPGALALSSDGSHLFATLGGAPAIASIDLVSKQSSSFSVLNGASTFYWSAKSIVPIAGEPNGAIAVLAGTVGPASSVVAYDAGVPRKVRFTNGTGTYVNYVQAIFPGDAANALYAVDTALKYSDGSHEVYRLTVSPGGVSLDKKLNNLLLGPGDFDAPESLVYEGSRLFTSGAQVFKPDTTQLLGSVALAPAYGLPVPFSDRNEVVYVQSASPQISANLYDLATLRPQMSVQLLTGPPCGCSTPGPSALNVVAAVRAGARTIAIAAYGEIVIAPFSSFAPWPPGTAVLQSVSAGVQQLNLPVNAMSALPGTSNLLLATPDTAGSVGNSIVTYNPATSQIVNSAFIGSEPSILSVVPDGSAVYAYLSGEDHVARLNVASGSRDLVFAADPAGGTSQYGVYDMAATRDGGLAVTYTGAIGFEGTIDVTGADGAVAIFDNGVPRPQIDANSLGPFAGYPSTFNLALNDSGTVIYGYNSFLSSFELKRDAITKQGVQWLSSTGGLIFGYTATIRYAQGLLYTSRGSVVDPERSLIVGEFADGWLSNAGDAVVPDVPGGRVYFATFYGILVFDIRTHALLGRLPISLGPNIFNYPQNAVRFGSDGLAFLTTGGQLYIVSISAIPLLASPIPSPQLPFIAANGIVPVYSPVPAVQTGSWISIFGANLASSTATWNGSFPTSLNGTKVSIDNRPGYLWYVSPDQINMQVPDDSATGTVSVTVTTASGSATGYVTLSPFGPSLSLLDSQHVAAEILTPGGSGAYGAGTYDLVGPPGSFSFATRPVKPGESLVLYGVGFGPANPTAHAGQVFSGASPTTNTVTVTIGGQPAKVLFSGIVAAGLYQINVVVPPTPHGDQTIQATVGGVNTPSAMVTIQ